MADPLACLRGTTIGIALWSILYCFIQMAVMGWQIAVTRRLQYEFENRQIPAIGFETKFQAVHPGIYSLYTETPERRRINVLFALSIVNVVIAVIHLPVCVSLLYGAFKYSKNFIWPWFLSSAVIICTSTAYALLWWSGDVFNEELTMSVAEFVMSLCVNGLLTCIVMVYFWRLSGLLASTRPGQRNIDTRKRKKRKLVMVPVPRGSYPVAVSPVPRTHQYREEPRPLLDSSRQPQPKPRCESRIIEPVAIDYTIRQERPSSVPSNVPQWRQDWPDPIDPQLQRKLKRDFRRAHPGTDDRLDFWAPEPYDKEFPWKSKKFRDQERRKRPTQREGIERLYYENYPDELPDIPSGMRSSIRQDRERYERSLQHPPMRRPDFFTIEPITDC